MLNNGCARNISIYYVLLRFRQITQRSRILVVRLYSFADKLISIDLIEKKEEKKNAKQSGEDSFYT